MKRDLLNDIIKKAETRKNGVYQHKNVTYRVRDGHITHLVDGVEIFALHSGFLVKTGMANYGHRKILNSIKDE